MATVPPTSITPPRGQSSPAPDREGALWSDILKDVGWPTDVVVIDFETYFDADYSLKKMSTIEYIEDPRFEILGVAVKAIRAELESPSGFWSANAVDFLEIYHGENLERATVVMMNARFDGTILARKFGIVPSFVVDIRDLSRHLDARNRHSLKDICKRLSLPDKGDTMEFKGLHQIGRAHV